MGRNKIISVYTDGACSNNPGGPGGWAATINYEDRYDVISGHELSTTNNRMELTAVVEVLRYLVAKGYTKIIVHSDSAYVVNGVNKGWIFDWAKKGWKTNRGTDLANAELWEEIYRIYALENVKIKFKKVPGHAGDTFNEIADTEAKKEVEHAKAILSDQF